MAPEERSWREIPFAPDVLDMWDVGADHPADPEDPRRAQLRAALVAALTELIATRLTPRQRRIVELYFYDGRTQQEIAAELGISQQVVSRQLFGVVRNGRRIGGAVQRLRKICEDRGWDPSEWV